MTAPLFSVISPVYNVGRYLEEYCQSLENQTIGIENLEVILVDDGSTDDSLELLQSFAARYPHNVRVVHKENGGQASARNAGIILATAPWVCFPDPDDVLSPNYFESMRDYMKEPGSAETALFAGRVIIWDEATGKRSDSHPTSFRFRFGNSTTDLTAKPNFIHGNATVSAFKREVIVASGLRFDERLRTRFEDAGFIAEYLLVFDKPILGLVKDSRYFYRRRSDGSSTLQGSHSDARSYVDVPQFGHLYVLKLAQELRGEVPRWLQWFIIYDIVWMFKADLAAKEPTRALAPEVLSAFHRSVAEIMTYIEPESVLGFDMMAVPRWMREALAFGYSELDYVGPVYIGPTDAARDLIQICYRFSGHERAETIWVKGKKVQAHHAKTQPLDVLGRTVLRERKLWVSSLGAIRFELDGKLQPFITSESSNSAHKFRREQILRAERFRKTSGIPMRFRQVEGRMSTLMLERVKGWLSVRKRALRKAHRQDVLLGAILRLMPVRRAYAGAWALLDREFQANDSAEELYRWVRANKPQVKLRFVLRKGTADWARLKGDGFKLVDYGSYRWKVLMLLAEHVVSSHIDAYISNPLPSQRYGRPQWKLTFLQHGIIKGDISPWLNTKNIDVFVTSTEDEYRYISGESVYKFGPKEVRLTGLPRHDALLAKSGALRDSEVTQILIAPTWRKYLAGRVLGADSSVREANTEFMQSEYAQAWQELVQSEELRQFAAGNGLKIVFMPHPNIQPHLGEFAIPHWVETKLYGNIDVQDVVSRSAVMITDFSSIAFNMAYLYRPVVYYQFDTARYEAEHIEGKGYYDYPTHGFGPVVPDVNGVMGGLRSLWNDREFAGGYADRAKRTFPVRDGRNSERVFKAISDLNRPVSFARGSKPAAADSWENPDEGLALQPDCADRREDNPTTTNLGSFGVDGVTTVGGVDSLH
ncbi:CDP-glycerol glycerophosphotransferase, TagB/SpsB family [Cryobacterium psychrotolerans]|uniref:CDP-glycerol glycerophosphotransferase, TagB/SpsB family n=1 Tax=Cryobacterium psychrotolerans TaxID=386301 RepID=A0A1G9CKX5_9MICO|nr:CDP-glycerol glycerophosphotransferase family protein [Cryobacterium psychrotolerans]SDK52278.1 CDP-glycerol glycerophosphotransferase, TagB/SpsB family [Cryobacterium psychrotolerans]